MKKSLLIFFICLSIFTCKTLAQSNPYRHGTPHYWMAQATLNITAGKFDVAYEDLQKARKCYYKMGDFVFQVKALEAMGALKSNLGEWIFAKLK